MDQDTEKIIEEFLSRAPESIGELVASGDWKNDANAIAEKFRLDKSKIAALKNEILFVLIGMEPREKFAENVKSQLEIDSNMASWMAEDVNKNIFSRVASDIEKMWQPGEEKAEEPRPDENENSDGVMSSEINSGVGDDFEQIILNQAKAMQPAQPPVNLPTGIQQTEEKPKAIHDYTAGNDPYREPLE